MSEKSLTFEKSMERLDEIVKQMEQGNVPLENALQLFEEGTKLVKSCAKQLENLLILNTNQKIHFLEFLPFLLLVKVLQYHVVLQKQKLYFHLILS